MPTIVGITNFKAPSELVRRRAFAMVPASNTTGGQLTQSQSPAQGFRRRTTSAGTTRTVNRVARDDRLRFTIDLWFSEQRGSDFDCTQPAPLLSPPW
jgi:hypothetical protein